MIHNLIATRRVQTLDFLVMAKPASHTIFPLQKIRRTGLTSPYGESASSAARAAWNALLQSLRSYPAYALVAANDD